MKLPASTIIPIEKATRYLLVPQARGDKSAFLERAGYTTENADQLLQDVRVQLLPAVATVGAERRPLSESLRVRIGVALDQALP